MRDKIKANEKISHIFSNIKGLLLFFGISLMLLQCEKENLIETPTVPPVQNKVITQRHTALPKEEIIFKEAYIKAYTTSIKQLYDSVLKSGKYIPEQFSRIREQAIASQPFFKTYAKGSINIKKNQQNSSKKDFLFGKQCMKDFQ